MATSLEVTYTPQIAECHIIFFRFTNGEDTSETCSYTDTTTSVVGVPKTIVINLENYTDEGECLENYSELLNNCTVFTIEYDVVPCCDGEAKNFEFSVTNPTECQTWRIECTGGKCNNFNFTDCNGNVTPLVFILLSSTVYVCSKLTPQQYPGVDFPYIITKYSPNGCCECQQYSVKNKSITSLTYYYINCSGTFVTEVVPFEDTVTICTQGGAPFVQNPNDATITLIGECP